MGQYRLRTIMALIVIIALSIWVGMMIERARRPTPTNSAGIFDAPEEMVGPTTPRKSIRSRRRRAPRGGETKPRGDDSDASSASRRESPGRRSPRPSGAPNATAGSSISG